MSTSTKKDCQSPLSTSKCCALCGVSEIDLGRSFERCSKCKARYYCSKSCQVNHWRGIGLSQGKENHKQECSQLLRATHRSQKYTKKAQRKGVVTEQGQHLMEVHFKCIDEYMLQIEKNIENNRYLQALFDVWLSGQDTSRPGASCPHYASIIKQQHYLNRSLSEALYLLMHKVDAATDVENRLNVPSCPLVIFIEAGANPKGGNYSTPLHDLASMAPTVDPQGRLKGRQVALGKFLLKHGADVNASISGVEGTPLHVACRSNVVCNTDFIDLLLKHGANVNSQDMQLRLTCIMCTIPYNVPAALHLLKVAKINVNLKGMEEVTLLRLVQDCLRDMKAERPQRLYRIEERAFKAVVAQLEELEQMILSRNSRAGADSTEKAIEPEDPYEAQGGNMKHMKKLVDSMFFETWNKGEGVEHQQVLLDNNIQDMLVRGESEGLKGGVQTLIYQCLAIALDVSMKSDTDFVAEDYESVAPDPCFPVNFLLSKGANPTRWSGSTCDTTPFHQLATLQPKSNSVLRKRQLLLGKILLERGADPNATNLGTGHSILHAACHFDTVANIEFIDLLLEYGADLNAQSNNGWTCLMESLPDNVAVAKHLLEVAGDKVNVNLCSNRGVTLLGLLRHKLGLLRRKEQILGRRMVRKSKDIIRLMEEVEEHLVRRGALEESKPDTAEGCIVG